MKKRYLLTVPLLLFMSLFWSPAPAGALPTPPGSLIEAIARQTDNRVSVAYHAETGLVRFIGTDSAHAIPPPTPLADNATAETAARQFLATYGPLFGLQDQAQELRVMQTQEADRGRAFVRFQQTAAGVPILGGELIVQLDSQRNIISANGETLPERPVSLTPTLSAETAQNNGLAYVAKIYAVEQAELTVNAPELWIYSPGLLGAPGPRAASLVWRMEVQSDTSQPIREFVLIDAQRGYIALNFSQIETAKYRKIYDNQNNRSYGLPGNGPVRVEGGAASSVDDVNKAYDYSGDVYDFYWNQHGRDSIDGAGMELIQTVRYCPSSTSVSCPYANAFWNGAQMVYGQGFAAADDVVAHEMTHGVTDYESRLFYYMQSGAINESFSDIWGEFIDLSNGKGNDAPAVRWLMGEDVPGGAIRSMKNPPAFSDPDRMSSSLYVCSTDDYGGVHTNGGVGNKAAYLLADGDTFNGKTVTGLGIVKTAKIFYEVQTHLFTSAGDYQDLYTDLQQACTNLAGTGGITAADCQQVKNAIDAVEMNRQPTSCAADEAPVCQTGQTATDLFADDLENPGSGRWTKQTVSGSASWFYPQNPNSYSGFDATYGTSGQYNFFGDDPNSSTNAYIAMTQNVSLPGGSTPYLHFNHAYAFETGFDGGVLEYSTNGGSTWSDIGAMLRENGYRGTLSSANPLGARSAFTNRSNGYISTRADLSSLAGQNVRFRFHIGTDSSVGGWGWFIDDIRIYTCATPLPHPDVSIAKSLSGGNLQPGSLISFILTVRNIGNANATQIVIQDQVPSQVTNLSYNSTLPVSQAGGTPYTWNLATLAPGQSGTITINGRLSTNLPSRFAFVNTATISASGDVTPANNTSRVTVGGSKIYMPLSLHRFPPFPDTPVLNPIDNGDGDGNYVVSWQSAFLAENYTLQEANNAAFANPTTVYNHGTGTSWSASGKAIGGYYYRVRASNAWGDSAWSTPRSVTVPPPPPPVPTLNPINNADNDSNYDVTWNGVAGANSYMLQEDDNAGFAHPDSINIPGTDTSWTANGKPDGTYYYRVRATNAYGDSAWSNVQSASVGNRPTPGFWQRSGGGLKFDVSTDRQRVENFAVYVTLPGCGTGWITRLVPASISGNSFSFAGSYYASGTFMSPTSASGTWGLNNFCVSGCGCYNGGPFSWTADWVHSAQAIAKDAALPDLTEQVDIETRFEVIPVP